CRGVHRRLRLQPIVPPLRAGGGVDRVEKTVPRAEVHRAAYDDGIGGDGIASREKPCGRECVDRSGRETGLTVERALQIVSVSRPVGRSRNGRMSRRREGAGHQKRKRPYDAETSLHWTSRTRCCRLVFQDRIETRTRRSRLSMKNSAPPLTARLAEGTAQIRWRAGWAEARSVRVGQRAITELEVLLPHEKRDEVRRAVLAEAP